MTMMMRKDSYIRKPFWISIATLMLLLLASPPQRPFSCTSAAEAATAISMFTKEEQDAAQRLINGLSKILLHDQDSDDDDKGEDDKEMLLEDLRSQLADLVEDANTIFPIDDDDEYQGKETTGIPQDASRDPKTGEKIFYADRLVRDMLETISDPDCMVNDMDAKGGNIDEFDILKAAKIYQKCRLLVIRNLFSPSVLEPYKMKVSAFLDGMSSGRIGPSGTTNFGEPYFFYDTAPKRWEVAFPKELADHQILANDILLGILRSPRVLGPDMRILDFGGIVAEPGAPGMYWHTDGGIYEDQGVFETTGMGGHDLPPFDVGVVTPFVTNMTTKHGPTEFCLGTTNLACSGGGRMPLKFVNKTLEEEYDYLMDHIARGACPAQNWRAPKLNFGDVLLFAFDIHHRGGPNQSNDTRFIMYNTYARPWFRDANYGTVSEDLSYGGDVDEDIEYDDNKMYEFNELLTNTRFGVPDNWEPEDPEITAARTLNSMEQMRIFRKGELWNRDNRRQQEEAHGYDAKGKIPVPLTNINVDPPPGGKFILCHVMRNGSTKSDNRKENSNQQTMKCWEKDIPVGQTHIVPVDLDDTVQVYWPLSSSSAKLLFSWDITYLPLQLNYQEQCILDKDYVVHDDKIHKIGQKSSGSGEEVKHTQSWSWVSGFDVKHTHSDFVEL